MITLRFVSHPGIFNWACSIAQYGWPYTHVETVMPDGTLLGAMSDGVKARPSGYDAGKYLDEMYVHVSATPQQEAAYYAFLRSQIGKPYDTWAIISFYSKRQGRDWQAPDSWFCSELQGDGFVECGRFPQWMANMVSRLTPRDLFLLASIEAG